MATVFSGLTPNPLFLQALGGDPDIDYSGDDMRHLLGAVFPRLGCVGALSMRIYQRLAGANWSIDVNSGFAVLGNSTSELDRYLVNNGSRINIPLTGFVTSPAATRTHRVFLVVYDATVVGTLYGAYAMVTEDTGAGAPVPTLNSPAYYLELGTLTVASGQSTITTAQITNTCGRAAYGYGNADLPLLAGSVSGAGPTDGGPPRYSISGSTVKLHGTISKSSGSYSTVTDVGTLPEGFRPKYERYMAIVGSGGTPCRLTVKPTGTVTFSIPSGSVTYFSLDGAAFELD